MNALQIFLAILFGVGVAVLSYAIVISVYALFYALFSLWLHKRRTRG